MLATVAKPFNLKIFFSNKYAYAQIIRSLDGHIIASVGTIEKQLREELPSTRDVQACSHIGKVLAERALANKVPAVHWDRKHGQKFHGKIAALLTSMREAGLPTN